MKSGSKKARKAQEELEALKKVRRRAIVIFVVAILAIVAMALIRQACVIQGIIPSDDTASNTIIFVISLGLCFIIAPWSNTFIRAGRRIRELKEELA